MGYRHFSALQESPKLARTRADRRAARGVCRVERSAAFRGSPFEPLAFPDHPRGGAEDVAFRRVQTVRSKGGLPGPGKSPWLLGLRGSGVVSLLRHQQLAIENWSRGYRSELRYNREAHAGCSEKAGKGLGRSWLPPGYTHVRLDEAKIAFTMTRKRGFCGLTRSTAPSRPANPSQRGCRRACSLVLKRVR